MDKSKEEIIKYVMNELIENGNLAVIDEIYSADYVAHAGDKQYSGHSFLKRFSKQLRTSFPDMRTVGVKFLADDGDLLTWQRTLRGTHQVTMQRIPASNKKIKWVDMVVTRFENGKIAEEWVVSELMGEMLLKVPRVKK